MAAQHRPSALPRIAELNRACHPTNGESAICERGCAAVAGKDFCDMSGGFDRQFEDWGIINASGTLHTSTLAARAQQHSTAQHTSSGRPYSPPNRRRLILDSACAPPLHDLVCVSVCYRECTILR